MAARMTGARQLVIDTLTSKFDGSLSNQDGEATKVLLEAMGGEIDDPQKAKSLANHLKKMEDVGLITRDVKGKRTYEITVAGNGAVAVKHERDGLRQRAKALESNIDAILNGRRVNQLSDKTRKELEFLMRAPEVEKTRRTHVRG